MNVVLDTRSVACAQGETILDVCRRNGINVPTICHDPALPLEGGCRMCLVEVDGRVVAACHTPVADGLHITSDSARLSRLRRNLLQLVLGEHPVGRFRASPDGTPFERLLARHCVSGSAPGLETGAACLDDSHPYLRFDDSKCIVCRHCLNACASIQGQFVYGVANRGAATRIIFGPEALFGASDCTACGACVDHCPTGAISDRDRVDQAIADAAVDTVCGYCGAGCRAQVATKDGIILSITGIREAEVNQGHLCAKGRYAHAYQGSTERLTTPLLRESGGFNPISWDEAVEWAANRLLHLRGQHGPDALAAVSSARSTNESAYLLQKLFRTAIGTNNVDCCARVCHSSTALALRNVTGTGAATASYADIERAQCIVVAGANVTEAHPVLGARIKQAALRGTPLIVIDPRHIELADYASVHLRLRPGTNVPLFNAIAKVLIQNGTVDHPYIEERTEGYGALCDFLNELPLYQASAISHVDTDAIEAAARLIGSNGPTLFVHGLGLSEITQGTGSVMALCNLGMLTGSIGRTGAGMLPLRGQCNVQGNADMGCAPDTVTGYQAVADPRVQERMRTLWGTDLPARSGLRMTEMFDAVLDGRLKGIWMQGANVAQSQANQAHTIAALEQLDLLIVQDIFFCETAEFAHLVLPAAASPENDGTYTNGERRVQRVRPAVAPPGIARPDWQAVRDVALRLGCDWHYDSPSDVMDEIARVAPGLFGGIRYSRLEGEGIQWPCPTADHPGTPLVHSEGFLRGKGLLVAIPYKPSPEQVSRDYAFLLVTGRVLHHYNVGSMTRRSPNAELEDFDYIEIHPLDAARLELGDNQRVRISSRWGSTGAPLRLSTRVPEGVLFLSFHYPQSHVNRLIGPHIDPDSKCPDYKVTAVRIDAE